METRQKPTPSAPSKCPPTVIGERRLNDPSATFPSESERQPIAVIRALGAIKRAAAEVNAESGDLDPDNRQGDRDCRR